MPYSDYPEVMTSNAKRGLELNEENGGKCATAVGKETARILSSGESLSEDRVVRMYSYLSRAETYYNEDDPTACGTISYLMWGGKPALTWSRSKVEEMEENRAMDMEELTEAIIEAVEDAVEEVMDEVMAEEPTQEDEPMEEEEEMVDERSAINNLEARSIACEFRADEEDGVTIEGYAARYDEETEIGGQFVERISRGAFSEADMSNVVALFNHDWNMPLARVGRGLELWDDGQGLKYRFKLGNQSYAKDLAENIRTGNVSTSSFGFTVEKDRWEKRGSQPLRIIERVKKLYDVSPTTQGAYPTTDVAISRMMEFEKLVDNSILPQPFSPEIQTQTSNNTMENPTTPAYIQSLGDSEANVAKRFSFGKAIREAAEGRLTGLEAEMNAEARNEFTSAKINVSGGISIPSMVLRTHGDPMSVANTVNTTNHSWGGTVGSMDAGLIPYMMPQDIATQLGVRNLSGLSGNVVFQVAKPSLKLAPEKLAEGAPATADNIEFAAKTLSPSRYSAYVRATEQLLAQSADDMGAFIAAEIRKAVDKKFSDDVYAAIKGNATTGSAYNQTTPGTLDTFNADSKNPLNLESELLGRDVNLSNVKVLCAPNAYRKARTMSLDAGSGLLFSGSPLDRKDVLGYPTVVYSGVTAGEFFMFDSTQLVTGEWGGLNLVIDPYTDAHLGVVRILANVYKSVTTLQDECFDGVASMA
jgi:HK97 family phage prohead protease